MIANALFKQKSKFKLSKDVETYISRSQVIPLFDEVIMSRETYGKIYNIQDHMFYGKKYENSLLTKYYKAYLSKTKIQTLIDALDDF